MVGDVYRLIQDLAIHSPSVVIGLLSILSGRPIKSTTVAICGQCLWGVRTGRNVHPLRGKLGVYLRAISN